MATAQENIARFQEIANRGLQDRLDPEMRARFDEAANRGIIQIEAPTQTGQAISPQILNFAGVEGIGDTVQKLTTLDARFREGIGAGIPEQEALRLALRPTPTAEAGRTFVKGTPEAATSIITGAIAEPVAGLAGLAATNPLASEGAGARTTQAVKKALTFQPRSEAGKSVLKEVGQTLGTVFDPIKKASEAAGQATLDVTGSPLLATVVQAAPEAAAEIFGAKGLLRGRPKIEQVEVPAQVRVAQEAAEQTGIPLFEAQKTLDAARLEKQSFVQQLPSGAQKAAKELETQNIKSSNAVDDLLSQIAPDDAIVRGSDTFRSASKRAIQAKKDAREAVTSPLYDEAFKSARKQKTFVDVKDLVDETRGVSTGFPVGGEISKSFGKINKWLDSASRKSTSFSPTLGRQVVERQNLTDLHNAKLEIDQMLSRNFDGSLGNTTKRKLVEIKESLVNAMDEASPQYREARAKFEELSPPVNRIEESIIGKVANLSDTQLKSVSRQIFDPTEVNPKNIADAKKLIDEADPSAWNMLFRSEIERRMGGMKPDVGGALENIPGKLHSAIFGNSRQKQVLMAGASGEMKKQLAALDVALKRASRGRQAGSQTASRAEISAELKGGLTQGLRDLFKKPLDTIADAGQSAAFNSRVSALTEALFNPRWQPQTTRILRENKGEQFFNLIVAIEALDLQERTEAAELQQLQAQAQQATGQ